jgi:hypothetical protein
MPQARAWATVLRAPPGDKITTFGALGASASEFRFACLKADVRDRQVGVDTGNTMEITATAEARYYGSLAGRS